MTIKEEQPTKSALRSRKWRANHPDEAKARSKQYREEHKTEIAEKHKKIRAADLEKWRARDSAYYLLNKEKILTYSRRYQKSGLYGMAPGEYEKMLISQDYRCAICQDPFPDTRSPCIDHCHTTNVVRGIICPACNKGLGTFKDSSSSLLAAAKYLDFHSV